MGTSPKKTRPHAVFCPCHPWQEGKGSSHHCRSSEGTRAGPLTIPGEGLCLEHPRDRRGVGPCVTAMGQGLWWASLQEGSWAPVISKETPPRKTAWSGHVAPGEGTMMAAGQQTPYSERSSEMRPPEPPKDCEEPIVAGRPGQQLRGTAQGTPLPLAPSGLSCSQVGGWGDQVGLRQSAGTSSSSQAAHLQRQGLDVR